MQIIEMKLLLGLLHYTGNDKVVINLTKLRSINAALIIRLSIE